jgi:hypothetical protein
MNSIPTSKAVEPADERLAQAYQQIKRADEELARVSEQVAKMERDDARPSSAEPGRQSAPRRPAFRPLVALLLAACIVVTALVFQSSYGAGAKLVVARWAPQLVSTSPPEKPPLSEQPAPSTVQVAAEAAPPQAAPLAQGPPQDPAPAATAGPPDQTQLLQTMARDLANVQLTIEQLKANQQQMASDNLKTVDELKASQEELKRALARVSEQNPPKASAPPTQPTPTLRKPERTVQAPHARARPRIPEWMYDEW